MHVPKDIYGSGVGIRSWVNSTLFGETRQEVSSKLNRYMGEYDPRGYGTRAVTPIKKHHNGYYYINITRYSSCD